MKFQHGTTDSVYNENSCPYYKCAGWNKLVCCILDTGYWNMKISSSFDIYYFIHPCCLYLYYGYIIINVLVLDDMLLTRLFLYDTPYPQSNYFIFFIN